MTGHGLTPEQLTAFVVESCEASGVPVQVEDDVALLEAARLVLEVDQ